MGCLTRKKFRKWFGAMTWCCSLLCAPSSLVSWDLSIISGAAWWSSLMLQHGCCIGHAVIHTNLAMIMRNSSMSGNNPTNYINQTHEDSHYHSFLLHNIVTALMLWYNAAPSLLLLCAQNHMFVEATSFNQDLSSWDVSQGQTFVSGLEAWYAAACRCVRPRRLCLEV